MSKRKRPSKSKPATKHKRKSAARKTRSKVSRAALFSRAPSQATPLRAIDQSDAWTEWGRRRSENPYEARRRQVYKILVARGVASDLAQQVANLDPFKHYIVEIYGFAGSDPNDEGSPGDLPVRQAVFVGQGVVIWTRVVGYAKKAPIEHIEIHEIDPVMEDRPLWDQYSVHTVEGVEIYGHGNLEEWKDRQKVGRRKKGGGGMSAPERRKNRKAKTAALKRKEATRSRVNALKQTDPLAAERLLQRSQRARKIKL